MTLEKEVFPVNGKSKRQSRSGFQNLKESKKVEIERYIKSNRHLSKTVDDLYFH
jgi:hypothetical protein